MGAFRRESVKNIRFVIIVTAILCIALAVSVSAEPLFSAQLPPGVEALVPEVIATYPHDPNAYTQGLLIADGVFYESTGRRGSSSVREVAIESGEVLRLRDVPPYFAEGLALVDDRLIQLTWQDGIALVYDRDTFAYTDAYFYLGEGWGLCYDGESLYHSDGSQYITRRDAATFAALERIEVTYGDRPVIQLNELECVGDDIYANVWQTDFIVRIDKRTGAINGLIDASQLLAPEQRPTDSNGVLNGIAYDPEEDVFYVTGKLWQSLFKVRFVPFVP
jgi:glutamine cyclotransferase